MEVELPDGTVIEDVPEGTTQSELSRRYGLHIQAQQSPTYSPAVEAKARADIAAQPLGQDVSLPQQIGSDLLHGAQATGGHVLAALSPDKSFLNDEAKHLISQGDQVTAPTVGMLPELAITAPLGGAAVKGAGLAAKGLASTPFRQLLAAALARTGASGAVGAGLGALNTAGTDESTGVGAGVGAVTGAAAQGLLGEALPGVQTGARALKNALIGKLQESTPPLPKPPAVDPQILAAAQARGFVPHPGVAEDPATVAARDLANRNLLTTKVTGLLGTDNQYGDFGGPTTDQQAADEVANRFRPALERFGQGIGGKFDEFYAGKRVPVDSAKNPQLSAEIDAAIANEQKLATPDQAFINTAKKLKGGSLPNPLYANAGETQRTSLQKQGIPEFLDLPKFPGYDPATGTVPADVLQANITEFGRRSASGDVAHSKLGYGSLSTALKNALEGSLTPADSAKLAELKGSYKYFKDVERETPNKDVALLNAIKSGDQDTLTHLGNILDAEDHQVVQRSVGQSLLSDLEAQGRGGRPSQPIDPSKFERGYNQIAPEARQAFLPDRNLSELSRISGGLLSPQEGLALKQPPPQGLAATLARRLMGVGSGLAGGAVGAAGGHSLAGYVAGHALGEDYANKLLARLLQARQTPLAETAPLLSGGNITPALAQALLLSGGAQ